MRVFFAIPIFDEAKSKIEMVQNELKRSYLDKYTDRENLHITLVFIGNVDENTIDMLAKIKISDDLVPTRFTLRACGVHSFKNGEVTYLKVEKNKEIEKLNAYIESYLTSCRIPFEKREEFIPHITLRRGKKELINVESDAINISVDSFALYESRRENGILKYVPIKVFKGAEYDD